MADVADDFLRGVLPHSFHMVDIVDDLERGRVEMLRYFKSICRIVRLIAGVVKGVEHLKDERDSGL